MYFYSLDWDPIIDHQLREHEVRVYDLMLVDLVSQRLGGREWHRDGEAGLGVGAWSLEPGAWSLEPG
ncbi:hypothetical protein PanWU01x14_275980 [Parasponia andersonii]|uniref:Uncharacterized protein n=1 Tax=Parasponia andersonii TaxID=3476 RepID=A0A2P5B394_PARAD|nr:hypothetical protein PanWU01x14_275980 [Parasponia andersonii]